MNLTDHFLPLRYHKHKLISFSTYGGAYFGADFGSMVLKTETYMGILPGTMITVGRSFLLSNPKEMLIYYKDISPNYADVFQIKPYEGAIVVKDDDQHSLPFIYLMAGFIFIFYRKPFPMVYVFFWLSVAIINFYGLWYISVVGDRFELFLKLFG